MSCRHGNSDDECELCDEVSDIYRRWESSSREQDARIAELTAEVAKYKAALVEIAGKEGELPWSRAACESIARNALKESR